jgi:hypothetical protein
VADLNLDALAPDDHHVTIEGKRYAVPAEIGIPRVIESVKLRRQLMEAEGNVRRLSVEHAGLQAEYLEVAREEQEAGNEEEKRKAVAEKLAELDKRFEKLEADFTAAEDGVDSSLTALYDCAMGFLRMRDGKLRDLPLTPRHTMAILGLVAGAEEGGVAEAVADALGGGGVDVDPTKPKPERKMTVPKSRKPKRVSSSRSKKASSAPS